MFAAGDGHELEDYTDEQGRFHLAHAKSVYSSSMLAYNFFHWICPEHPLTLNGIVYDKVYFEVKFPVLAKNADGSLNNRPSNMDVVLISDDCAAMLCIESKYTEHTHKQKAEFSDAYFKPSCYYQGNPYRASFIKMALRYNEKNCGYYTGIKQNISHLIGLTNIMHDADALAWFKANNPFIEPEVIEKLCPETEITFTNLLYFRPELVGEMYGDLNAKNKTYPYLLGELLFEHLQKALDEPLLLSSFIYTYPELFNDVKSQIPKPLADYLDKRYVLTTHFPLVPVIAGTSTDGLPSEAIKLMIEMGIKGVPVLLFSRGANYETMARIFDATIQEKSQLQQRINEMRDKPIFIDDTQNISLAELLQKINTLVNEKGVKFVFIDDILSVRDMLNTDSFIEEHREEIERIISSSKNKNEALSVLQKQFEIGYIKANRIFESFCIQ
jgi:hypothetical protein